MLSPKLSFLREKLFSRLDLSGQHVFITGGSTGLGLAVAIKAAKVVAVGFLMHV